MPAPKHYVFALEVERVEDAARFGRRDVPPGQLEPLRAQIRFQALREGRIEPEDPAVDAQIEPVFHGDAEDEISALRLSLRGAGGGIVQSFGLDAFDPFGDQLAGELLKSRHLAADDKIRYRVFAGSGGSNHAIPATVARVRQQPLPLLPGRLADFLPLAEPVGPVDERDYPVFVLNQTVEQARSVAWKGRDLEGGVWMIGNLFRQADPSPEIFCLIHAVIDAKWAAHERFSIDLSPETYTYRDAQLERRRKRFGRVGELVCGMFHTHPFMPSVLDNREACPRCPLRPTCDLSSSFFSKRDAAFHRANFGRAPYAVEMVLGLSPREEFDLNMFCPDGGGFRRRGYYQLPEIPAGVLDAPNLQPTRSQSS